MSSSSSYTADTPPASLILIIRFATSIPDLRLPIPSPSTTSAATLCTLIRPHLPPDLSSCALRLIYAGALLSTTQSLASSLRLQLPPSLSSSSVRSAQTETEGQRRGDQQQKQLYIHCSIASDTILTAAELETERRLASSFSRKPLPATTTGSHAESRQSFVHSNDDDDDDDDDDHGEEEDDDKADTDTEYDEYANGSSSSHREADREKNTAISSRRYSRRERRRRRRSRNPAATLSSSSTAATTTINQQHAPSPLFPSPSQQHTQQQHQHHHQPQPQGFDRLQSAGLLPTEIASLRSQFLAIQSHTHTPDTMPTPAELRVLEDRWLDNDTNTITTSMNNDTQGAGVGNGNGSGYDDDEGEDTETNALNDMLWGNVMGFFWAVGGLVWLVREEGVWTKRRQIGVVTGVLVNVAFCVLRIGS